MDYERLVVDNLQLVDSVIRLIARRHRLSADEAEELAGAVRLKLVDNDYEVLRKFEGRSQLRTYLITVVQRHCLDDRNARWGKWRPSAQARRLGPIAMMLDQLLSRDHLPFEEAVHAITARHGTAVSREQLHAISDNIKLARIAELLGLPQKPFYRRVDDLQSPRHLAHAQGGRVQQGAPPRTAGSTSGRRGSVEQVPGTARRAGVARRSRPSPRRLAESAERSLKAAGPAPPYLVAACSATAASPPRRSPICCRHIA